MRKIATALLLMLPLLATQQALAGAIQQLKKRVDQPTEIMVLGARHIRGIKGLTPAHLDGLHVALMRYRPQAIVVETIASHQIELMLQRPGNYADTLQQFVGKQFIDLAAASRKSLSVTAEQARKRLAECDPLPLDDAPELAHCMQLAAAAYDKVWFEYIAWQYGKRHADAVLPGASGKAVAEIAAKINENQWIAARLADALGHSRVYAMDDQDSGEFIAPILDALEPSLKNSKAVADFGKQSKMIRLSDEAEAKGLAEGDLLPLYVLLNSDMYGDLDVDEEWRLFVDRDLPRKLSLSRLAMWDMRNLTMASNLMRVVAFHPSERVLVTVGASHKPFLDDYLNRSIGIRLRQLDEFTESAKNQSLHAAPAR